MQSSAGFDGKLTGDHKIPINRLGESVGNKTFGTDNSGFCLSSTFSHNAIEQSRFRH